MADLYGVSADFLPGRCESHIQDSSQPISLQSLPAFHGRPCCRNYPIADVAAYVLSFLLIWQEFIEADN